MAARLRWAEKLLNYRGAVRSSEYACCIVEPSLGQIKAPGKMMIWTIAQHNPATREITNWMEVDWRILVLKFTTQTENI
eukprot:215734-Amphidinium_carterae.1